MPPILVHAHLLHIGWSDAEIIIQKRQTTSQKNKKNNVRL